MIEKIELNTKLAILGAGCTQQYAEKTTNELMSIIEEIILEAKKDVFNDLQEYSAYELVHEFDKIKERHLSNFSTQSDKSEDLIR